MRKVSPIIEINLLGRATYKKLKIGEEGYNTFTYACVTLLQRVKKKTLIIIRQRSEGQKSAFSNGFRKFVGTKLTPPLKMLLHKFTKFLSKKPWSFLFHRLIYMFYS